MTKVSIFALTLALAPSMASAQSYQRLISFGDSLIDNGNLFSITRQPPSPPYNQRFTNGRTFAEYLAAGNTSGFISGAAGPGNVNYAFGGARNDANSNTNDVPGSGFTIPSTISQIAAFRVRGGVYGANDVVNYWGGANNLFQSTAAASLNPVTAQAVVSADSTAAGLQVGSQVGQLATAGARTILVYNLADFGSLPAYSSLGAQGASLGSFASFTYNNASNQSVQAAAAANPGANIIQVDTAALFAAAVANPSSFGFANVTQACLRVASCALASFDAQNQFLFFDDVHPTDAGHRLLAAAVGEYLYAPSRTAGAAVLGEVGLWSRRTTTLDLLDKTRAAQPKGEAIEYFVAVAGSGASRTANVSGQQIIGGAAVASSQNLSYSQGGLRIGGFKSFANGLTAGFQASGLTGEASSGAVSASPTSISGDLSVGWRQGPAFVNGLVGVGAELYSDYRRTTAIAAITQRASTNGVSASAAVEGGYDAGFGALTVTPLARLTYLYANVSSFDENAAIASVRFDGRTLQGLTGAFELRAKAKVAETATLSALVGYEEYIARSFDGVGGRLINNTAQPFTSSASRPAGAGFLFGVGAEAAFGAWKAGVNYRGSVGERSLVTHQGEAKLSANF